MARMGQLPHSPNGLVTQEGAVAQGLEGEKEGAPDRGRTPWIGRSNRSSSGV